jgi:hypothetical protein
MRSTTETSHKVRTVRTGEVMNGRGYQIQHGWTQHIPYQQIKYISREARISAQSRVLETPTVIQLVKKLPTFSGTQRFIILLKNPSLVP